MTILDFFGNPKYQGWPKLVILKNRPQKKLLKVTSLSTSIFLLVRSHTMRKKHKNPYYRNVRVKPSATGLNGREIKKKGEVS